MRVVRGRAGSAERGSGTVLTVGLVAVVLMLIVAISLLAQAQSARGAAQTAADLGALAAAQHLVGGSGDEGGNDLGVDGSSGTGSAGAAAEGSRACAIARTVVVANGSSLTGCALLGGGVVRLTTARSSGLGVATASARAGPSEPPTSDGLATVSGTS